MNELILRRFEIVRIAGMTIGRATYEPGWKWVGDEPYVSLHFLNADHYARG